MTGVQTCALPIYLSDETYRVILKAKIAINNWDGRNDSLPAILDAATAGSGLRMQIVDNQDMTISVWLFPDTDISDVSRELIAAIKQGYLTVKAAGVWAGGIETPSVETPSEGSKFFGFDMDNEFITGFHVGAWGVLLRWQKMTLKHSQRVKMPMLCRRRNGKRCLRFYPDLQQGKHPVRNSIRLFGRAALLLQLWPRL